MRIGKTKLIATLVGLALMIGVGVRFLVATGPQSQVFSNLSDYDRVLGPLGSHPALVSFPPSGTPLPAGSVFSASISPGQGADRISLYVPGSGAALGLAPAAPVATGVPEPRMLDEALDALNRLAPKAEFGASTAATILLYHQFSTFSLLWTDSATGDRLYVALLD